MNSEKLVNAGHTIFYWTFFCYEKNGHSAVHVIVDNNGKRPYTNKSEFYITTVPASLNKFGQLLNDWNPMTEKEIKWTAE